MIYLNSKMTTSTLAYRIKEGVFGIICGGFSARMLAVRSRNT